MYSVQCTLYTVELQNQIGGWDTKVLVIGEEQVEVSFRSFWTFIRPDTVYSLHPIRHCLLDSLHPTRQFKVKRQHSATEYTHVHTVYYMYGGVQIADFASAAAGERMMSRQPCWRTLQWPS